MHKRSHAKVTHTVTFIGSSNSEGQIHIHLNSSNAALFPCRWTAMDQVIENFLIIALSCEKTFKRATPSSLKFSIGPTLKCEKWELKNHVTHRLWSIIFWLSPNATKCHSSINNIFFLDNYNNNHNNGERVAYRNMSNFDNAIFFWNLHLS